MDNSEAFYVDLARSELTWTYVREVEAECPPEVVMAIRQATMGTRSGGQAVGTEERVDELETSTVLDSGSSELGQTLEVSKRIDEKLKELPSVLKLKTPEEEVLFNPFILESIFSHLDLTSLLTARQVCKDWDDEAAKQISKSAAARIPIYPYRPKRRSKLRDFMKLFQSSRALVISNYHLCKSQNVVFPHPIMRDFFTYFGPSVKHLTIPIYGFEDLRRYLLKMRNSCPNLESLDVLCKDGEEEDERQRADVKVPGVELVKVKKVLVNTRMPVDQERALFSATPNIAAVEVDFGETLLETMIHCNRLSTLKEIRMESLWLPQDLKGLSQLSLTKLDFWELSMTADETFYTLLESFISSQGGTLRSLGLGYSGFLIPDPTHLSLQKLEALTDLSMRIMGGSFYTSSPDPERDFPKLKRVKLLHVDVTKDPLHKDPAPLVTELEVNLNFLWERDENQKSPVWSLSRMFPGVQSLTLEWPEVEDVALALVAWPNLKHLDLRLFEKGWAKVDRLSLEDVKEKFPFVLNFPGLKSLSVFGRKVYESSG